MEEIGLLIKGKDKESQISVLEKCGCRCGCGYESVHDVCKCECVGMVCGDTCVMAHTRKAEDTAVNSVLPPVSKSRGEPGSPTY